MIRYLNLSEVLWLHEMFLLLNGYEIDCPVAEQEEIVLQVASGQLQRDAFAAWLIRVVQETGE